MQKPGGAQGEGVIAGTSTAIIAHRGASGHAPEHTVAAFDAALQMGTEYLEFDVQLTVDGVPIVFHDLISSRTLRDIEEHGVISEMFFDRLRVADAGRWFNELHPEKARNFQGQAVLTLAEVLERYRHLSRFAIELKGRDAAGGIEWKVLSTLADYDLLDGDRRVVLMSLSAVTPVRLRSLAPDIELVQLFYEHEPARDMLGRLGQVRRYAGRIGPHYTQVTDELVQAAHAEELGVWTWAVNEVADMELLLDAGVDGIVTDFPDRLSAVLEARGSSRG
ncbi:MAG: glycerophosphodiester phosphodiesterase family protein [Actinomycetota bacterium]